MFGAFVRAAPTAVLGALLGALLAFVLSPFMDLMGPESGVLYRSFTAISDNVILIMLLSALLGLIARAAVERGFGV